MNVKTQAERSEATRAKLVGVARALFAKRGYAAVPAEEIVRRAGVTRGALYHHFGGKRELFAAVFEDVERELTEKIAGAALSGNEPIAQLRAGCEMLLDACLEPEVQRIVLLDGPAVLGWEAWREIEARYGLGLVQAALQGAMDAGAIEERPAGPLAHVMMGALEEGAMLVVRSDDVEAARAEVGAIFEHLIEGLRPRGA